jgi:hypothetical protein
MWRSLLQHFGKIKSLPLWSLIRTTDIGGRFSGDFSSQCTETYEEGATANSQVLRRRRRNEAFLESVLAIFAYVR